MRVEGPFEDITFKVIGAAMAVHNALGPGLKESAYHHALSLELEKASLSFEEEKPVEIFLDGASVGLLYLDHLVEGSVVVEEKAFSHLLTDEEVAQVITYLAATGLPVGILLNFGRKRLQYRRIFPPRKLDAWRDRISRYVWRPKSE
ncbi:MAG: GxxExxY protein [Chloroflexota bacterium]|nr:GxxExxY protein [Chloroflexota bacterium]